MLIQQTSEKSKKSPYIASLFGLKDARKVAKEFVKFPDIVQVGVFGSVARYGMGSSIELALIVGDDRVFRRYVELVREYHHRMAMKQDARQVRLSVFDVVFGTHNPNWHNFHPERKLDLRTSFDLVVLPFDWVERIDDLHLLLGRAAPRPLFDISVSITLLETSV